MEKKYNYSFAELLDRCVIISLKEIASETKNEAFAQEVQDILKDIQFFLDSKAITSEQVRALIILSFVNKHIFDSETDVRENLANYDNLEPDKKTEVGAKLVSTHKLNSLRATCKKIIQDARGERTDPKLNYSENTLWNISW